MGYYIARCLYYPLNDIAITVDTSSLIQNSKPKTELVLDIWNRRSIPKKIRETTSKRKVKCLV